MVAFDVSTGQDMQQGGAAAGQGTPAQPAATAQVVSTSALLRLGQGDKHTECAAQVRLTCTFECSSHAVVASPTTCFSSLLFVMCYCRRLCCQSW